MFNRALFKLPRSNVVPFRKLSRAFSDKNSLKILQEGKELEKIPDQMQDKLQSLQSAKPQFDTIMTFDADSLSHLPPFLERLDPFIQAGTVNSIHPPYGKLTLNRV